MPILGEYRFGNYTIINAFEAHDNGIESTLIHETFHLALTKSTSYGFFATLANRVVNVDRKYEYLNNILNTHMIRLQEAISTFSEVVYFASKNKFSATKNHITNLKENNRTYYNYMCPYLIRFIKFFDESRAGNIYVSPIELLKIVYTLSFISMNCLMVNIPIDILRNKRSLMIYMEQSFPHLYTPNSRFNKLLVGLYKHLHAIEESSFSVYNALQVAMNGIDDEELHNNIIFDSEKKEIFLREHIEKTKEYFKILCEDSKSKDTIYEIIEPFTAKAVDIERVHQYVIPSTFKPIGTIHKAEAENMIKFGESDQGIYFIPMDNSHDINLRSINVHVDVDQLEIFKKQYSEHIHLMYISLSQKASSVSMYPVQLIESLACNAENIIVLSYKLTELIEEFLKYKNRKVFVYCDRPYATAIITINEYIKTKKHIRFVQYKNMCIAIIRIDDRIDFFLPLILSVVPDMIDDISKGVLDLVINDNLDVKLDEYDKIINCLFSA